MSIHPEHFITLLKRFEEKKATPDEVETLFEYLNERSNEPLVLSLLEARLKEYSPGSAESEYWKSRLAEKLPALAAEQVPPAVPVHPVHVLGRGFFRYPTAKLLRWTSAAAILMIFGLSAYLWRTNRSSPQPAPPAAAFGGADVAPGGNKAILTLGDGRSIELDAAAKGMLAQQGGARIQKTAEGQILYTADETTVSAVLYNTMKTPRGGQYKLALPDGTNVWLNAASSITFPTVFTGDERRVSVTGEVYFEVRSLTRPATERGQNKVPFIVSVPLQGGSGTQIEVLGTHFNVNAYADEATINTTLLEGIVNVHANHNVQKLLPGQQAQVGSSPPIRVLDNVDTDNVMAWKNGAFSFKNEDLGAVLRQLSRWYDVNFEFKGKMPERKFSGKMGRDLSLSQILNFLKEIKLDFGINGNKITVTGK